MFKQATTAAQPGPDTTDRRRGFLVTAGGILHKAKLPGIPGIESFRGHTFHTSRWDDDYTAAGTTTTQAVPPTAT